MPQLPVAESDVVVAGQVTGLKIFLSANKKCLYTEYTFKVEDVGKPGVGIIAGDEIAILALGGVAKLPTGGILRMEIRGVPRYPVVGGRYLMFLIAEPAPSDAYAAIKYWNIDGDSVLFAHECVGSPSRQDKTPPSKKLLADVMFTIKAAK
jgi:hypothetical protein